MIHPKHLRELIIRPTLKYLDMWSESAENLLMGTCAQESHMGKYLMQIDQDSNPVGPALGIYQMEPDTHYDIWQTYLYRKTDLGISVNNLIPLDHDIPDSKHLIYNLKYATAMARLKYWRDPEPLPQAGDIEGLAHIYKRVFNTAGGKGTVEEFVSNYNRFISRVEND